MVPVPRAVSWEELNAQLQEECRKRRERKLWGRQETIAERFERDREKVTAAPAGAAGSLREANHARQQRREPAV